MIPLALVYAVLYFGLPTITGRIQFDGILGIVLGLYICSHPAANLVDRLIFGHYLFRPGELRRQAALWWGLNLLVMLTGFLVIFSGMLRFTVR